VALYQGLNSFPLALDLTEDGADRDASSVDVALEGLADRTVWLSKQHAFASKVNAYQTHPPGAYDTYTSTSYTDGSHADGMMVVQGLTAGDVVHIEVATQVLYDGAAATWADIRVLVTEQFGTTPTVHVTPGRIWVRGTGSDVRECVSLMTVWTVTAPGDMQVSMQGRVSSVGGTLTTFGCIALRAFVQRPFPIA